MKHQSYVTRALKARDPRYARVLGKLGYDTTAMAAEAVDGAEAGDSGDGKPDLDALRDTYKQVIGKQPFHGWDAETLAKKIEEHRAAK
ncbi:hypothetical protein [Sphingomonas sanxanigenens]|uniref:Uncharacterized protein n=1 Tax=Sphingomonas sanxanigenens DSM 19645 = NX02 TaxID=1123269 RepID=W0AHM1_9SPHN|nr:hypothetical protein [Sphingomonas sanxanigenens]AHE56017.1 hypothetical protein NX02_21940 [Sphingomonas sanxanigenens DSM 19645 = NX02]